jgi:hypothetical protein
MVILVSIMSLLNYCTLSIHKYVHDKVRQNVHFMCGSVKGYLRIIQGFLNVFMAQNWRIRALKGFSTVGIYGRKQNFALNFFEHKG